MTVRFPCPSCGRLLEVKNPRKIARCPACRALAKVRLAVPPPYPSTGRFPTSQGDSSTAAHPRIGFDYWKAFQLTAVLAVSVLMVVGGVAFVNYVLLKQGPDSASESPNREQTPVVQVRDVERQTAKGNIDRSEPVTQNQSHPDGSKTGVPSPDAGETAKSSAAFYFKRAGTWLEKKDYDKAIADFTEGIRLDPTDARAFVRRGFAWSMKKQYDKAIQDYDEAIRLNPVNAWAANARGNAWFALREYDKALKDYDETIRIDPKFAWAFNNRAAVWSNKKDYGKAIRDYEEAIRLDPMEPRFCCNFAWLLLTYPEMKGGDGDRAVELAKKACDLTEWKKGLPLTTLAAAYARAGRFEEAERYQSQALEDPAYQGPAGDDFRKRLEFYKQRRIVRAPSGERGTIAPPLAVRDDEPEMPGVKSKRQPFPGYEKRTIHGFAVLINLHVLDQDKNPIPPPIYSWQRRPLEVLELEIKTVVNVMPPKALKVLRAVPVWVEWDDLDPDPPPRGWVGMPGQKWPGAWAKYYGGSAGWQLRTGKDPRKAKCIEILSLRRITEARQPQTDGRQGCVILHELAHAVHFELLSQNNPILAQVYRQAVDRRLYDNVENSWGGRGPAYARTNANEYFAELTCAYLDRCKYFPFTRSDLKRHDPVGYQLMERVWGKPKRTE